MPINYNKDLDQVMISAHSFNELWVVDHSTTTGQAAGSSGGKSGKGGDLIYRWGNPRTYDRGTDEDQQLFNQHDVEWIPGLFPGAGRILVFNNGVGRPEGQFSTVDEIIPPVDCCRQAINWMSPGATARRQRRLSTRHRCPKILYGAFLSGAQRLRDGNTLITVGPVGQLFEVTPEGGKRSGNTTVMRSPMALTRYSGRIDITCLPCPPPAW